MLIDKEIDKVITEDKNLNNNSKHNIKLNKKSMCAKESKLMSPNDHNIKKEMIGAVMVEVTVVVVTEVVTEDLVEEVKDYMAIVVEAKEGVLIWVEVDNSEKITKEKMQIEISITLQIIL